LPSSQSKGRGQASVALSQVAQHKVIELDADLDGSSSSSDADGNGFIQKNHGARHAGAKNVIHINDSDSDSATETGGFLKNSGGATNDVIQVDDRSTNTGDICEAAAEAGGFLNNQDDATKTTLRAIKRKATSLTLAGTPEAFSLMKVAQPKTQVKALFETEYRAI
jgi:hypothetical protein